MMMRKTGLHKLILVVTLAGGLLAAPTQDACASTLLDGNRFAYVYPTVTLGRGEHQYEQWVTWTADKEVDSDYLRLEFRQEFEHGISDRLQFGFYLATWRYTRTSEGSNTGVHDSAVELIYNMTDPRESSLGSAVYGEVKFDSHMVAIEGKLLLEKYIGRWRLAYNGVLEQEWEGDKYAESKGEVKNILGVSTSLSNRFALGAEYLWEATTDDWSSFTKAVSYLGPNVTWATSGWWVTGTSLFKATDQTDEPGFQVRTKIGIPF